MCCVKGFIANLKNLAYVCFIIECKYRRLLIVFSVSGVIA